MVAPRAEDLQEAPGWTLDVKENETVSLSRGCGTGSKEGRFLYLAALTGDRLPEQFAIVVVFVEQ
jgi:hypothetical protein